MIYLLLPAQSIYDVQHRVMGHRHTPANRESLRQLKGLAPRLRELGITRVIASDLDEQSARAVSNKLQVPCELWESLRRWNWGKLHGLRAEKAVRIMASLSNPDVPVRGGDSLKSYQKRLAATRDKLKQESRVLVMAAERELSELLGTAVHLEHNRIYEADLGPAH